MDAGKYHIAIPDELLALKIYLIRGQKVMLDMDLAILYGVQTKDLKQAVRRNIDRFPDDFMFELSTEELIFLRSQIVTSAWKSTRYAPMAITGHADRITLLFDYLEQFIEQTTDRKRIGFRRLEETEEQ